MRDTLQFIGNDHEKQSPKELKLYVVSLNDRLLFRGGFKRDNSMSGSATVNQTLLLPPYLFSFMLGINLHFKTFQLGDDVMKPRVDSSNPFRYNEIKPEMSVISDIFNILCMIIVDIIDESLWE